MRVTGEHQQKDGDRDGAQPASAPMEDTHGACHTASPGRGQPKTLNTRSQETKQTGREQCTFVSWYPCSDWCLETRRRHRPASKRSVRGLMSRWRSASDTASTPAWVPRWRGSRAASRSRSCARATALPRRRARPASGPYGERGRVLTRASRGRRPRRDAVAAYCGQPSTCHRLVAAGAGAGGTLEGAGGEEPLRLPERARIGAGLGIQVVVSRRARQARDPARNRCHSGFSPSCWVGRRTSRSGVRITPGARFAGTRGDPASPRQGRTCALR